MERARIRATNLLLEHMFVAHNRCSCGVYVTGTLMMAGHIVDMLVNAGLLKEQGGAPAYKCVNCQAYSVDGHIYHYRADCLDKHVIGNNEITYDDDIAPFLEDPPSNERPSPAT